MGYMSLLKTDSLDQPIVEALALRFINLLWIIDVHAAIKIVLVFGIFGMYGIVVDTTVPHVHTIAHKMLNVLVIASFSWKPLK